MDDTLVMLLVQYSVGITVGFIIALISRRRCVKKIEELEKRCKEYDQYYAAKAQYDQQYAQQYPQQYAQPVYQAGTYQQAYQPQPQYVQPQYVQPQYAYAQPAPQVQPAPVKEPEPKAKPKISVIGIAFAVGVLLLIISATVFITASWHTTSAGAKCAVLCGVVSVVIGLSAVSKKLLKLENTSSALYSLGGLLIPIALLTGYLAFSFNKIFILLILCALSFAVTGAIGYFIYKSKLHLSVSYSGLLWVIVFICSEAIKGAEGVIFGLALACLVAAVIGLFFKNRVISIISEVLSYAAIAVFFAAYATGLPWQFIIMALSTAAFTLLFKKRKFVLSVMPSMVVIMAVTALYHIYDRVNVSEQMLSVIGMVSGIIFVAAYLAVCKLTKIESPFTNAYIVTGSFASAVMSGIMLNNSNEWLFFIPFLVTVAGVLILSRNKFEEYIYWPLAAIAAMIEIATLPEGSPKAIIVLALLVIAYAFALFSRKWVAGVSFAATSIFGMMSYASSALTFVGIGIALALYIATIIVQRFRALKDVPYHLLRVAVTAFFVYEFGSVLDDLFRFSPVLVIIPIVVSAAFIAASFFDPKDRFAGVVPTICLAASFIWLISDIDPDKYLPVVFIYFATIGLMLAFAVAGRFLYGSFCSKKHFDAFSICGLIFLVFGAYYGCDFFILLAVYSMTLIGRFGNREQSIPERLQTYWKPIISVVVASIAMELITLDMKVIPDNILFQLRLFWFILAVFIICFVIRLSHRKWIWFGAIVLVNQIELILAISSKSILPLSILFAMNVAICIFAFVAKRRAYMILGFASMIESSIGLSFVYWNNKFWWIYLLATGALMITLASVNEFRRRKAIESDDEGRKRKIFADWSW